MPAAARSTAMFTIDYGFGVLGALAVGLLVLAGVIGLVFLLTASKQAHDSIVEEEHDRGNDDVPIA